MASAAGIILATGGMTLANEYVQSKTTPDPQHPVASIVNWKVIPATVIAAGIFYGFQQVNEKIAVGTAIVAFLTAFAFKIPNASGQISSGTTPLGTLMTMVGVGIPANDIYGATPSNPFVSGGLPYTSK